jgi:chromate reductase
MNNKRKVLAISGSTRLQSTNIDLIKAIADFPEINLDLEIFEGLMDIPHFNPDHDTENPPLAVVEFRDELRKADGILICSPEYAMGVPGTLKNAIDWTVSSCEFRLKPTALITASSMGEKSHESLLGTLRIIEAELTDETQMLISFAKTKIKNGHIIDSKTFEEVKRLIYEFNILMSKARPTIDLLA